jgi:hypothetical protein
MAQTTSINESKLGISRRCEDHLLRIPCERKKSLCPTLALLLLCALPLSGQGCKGMVTLLWCLHYSLPQGTFECTGSALLDKKTNEDIHHKLWIFNVNDKIRCSREQGNSTSGEDCRWQNYSPLGFWTRNCGEHTNEEGGGAEMVEKEMFKRNKMTVDEERIEE